MKQYFSFGVASALSKFHVEIEGRDREDCRDKMMESFGKMWAFQYDKVPDANKTVLLPIKLDQYGFLKLLPEDLK